MAKHPAAVALGSMTSEKKAAAARENGKRGGRPKLDTTCERCGKKHLGEFVFLELNQITGRYAAPGTVPAPESQGLFRFGRACARRVLSAA